VEFIELGALSLEEMRNMTERFGINREIIEKSYNKRDYLTYLSVKLETCSCSCICGTIIPYMTQFSMCNGEIQK